MTADAVEGFIARWQSAGGSERGNYQLFLTELCVLLGLEGPQPQASHKPQPWPKEPVAQLRAVAEAVVAQPGRLAFAELEARFSGRGLWKCRLPQLLEMLVALGRVRQVNDRYVGA